MQLLISRERNLGGSAILLAVIVILLSAERQIFAQESASRKRQITRPRQIATATKPKPKTVGAQDWKEAKEKLASLGYWITPDKDSLRQALVAFQKVQELKRTGQLTFDDLEIMRAASVPAPQEIQNLETGKIRVEVDLRRQVLFVIDSENIVTRILTISSGNGKEFKSEDFVRDAITPPGRFKVYNQIKGWRKSALGMLYYPNYFLSGIAIHGSLFVPPYPDSHGCIRIPMFAAQEFYGLLELGTEILVYESRPSDAGNVVATDQAK